MSAAKFGQALCDSDGLVKKLVSIHADPIPQYFNAIAQFIPNGKHCALLMVAEFCFEPLRDLVAEFGGKINYHKTAKEASKGTSLAEFTWNHTTLHARNVDDNLTYLQTFFFDLERIEHMYHYFGDEVMMHLEFLRVGGKAIPAGLQLVRYTSKERLNEIISYHEERGAFIANPHTYILEDGGRKQIEPEQLQFKEKVDPHGLMNPGKMRAYFEKNK